MKRNVLAAAALVVAIGFGSWAQASIIDINLTRSGAPSQAGFTNWESADNSLPSNLTIAGLTLSAPSTGINAGTTLRSIDRGASAGYTGPLPSLSQTWWGQRESSTGPGGFITINIEDLAAGDYTFTSWHIDFNDQRGQMVVDFSANGGSSFSTPNASFTVPSVAGAGANAPVVQSFDFTSTGADVQFRFRNTSVNGVGSAGAFAVVNGFSIAVVPEPGSLALVGLGGLCGLVILRRRKR